MPDPADDLTLVDTVTMITHTLSTSTLLCMHVHILLHLHR